MTINPHSRIIFARRAAYMILNQLFTFNSIYKTSSSWLLSGRSPNPSPRAVSAFVSFPRQFYPTDHFDNEAATNFRIFI